MMNIERFPEALLHAIWQHQYFDTTQLVTTEGIPIQIINKGEYNRLGGPDFEQAVLKIGTKKWVGPLEIHYKSSEWYAHRHQEDAAYNTVILHLVYEHDKEVFNSGGQKIPVLELKGRIAPQVLEKSQTLLKLTQQVPCANFQPLLSERQLAAFLEDLAIERLEQQSREMQLALHNSKNDWESLCYWFLAKGFGLQANSLPMEQLARSIPFRIIRKYQSQSFQLEALLLGQAGFLKETFAEQYPQQLKNEYQFLAHKYALKAMDTTCWKFGSVRPAAFPMQRIAYFAKCLQQVHLFRKIVNAKSINELRELLNLQLTGFWLNHYQLKESSTTKKQKKLGEDLKNRILINVCIPLIFCYGNSIQNSSFIEKALNLLRQLKSETNKYTNYWSQLGIQTQNAMESQALLQLQKEYCHKKRCIDCKIGQALLFS